jgi:energy-coupling factor transporter ATP-binding protein EcfA2
MQKIAIDSVNAASPKIYVFDKPFANLNNDAYQMIAEGMRELKRLGQALVAA